jgi:4-hydroxy-2-oxoheptanedioate aldolase
MAIVRNLSKERLAAGKAIVGISLQFPSPALVEIAAYAGFHWVYIDCEHGPMSEESVEHMVRAAELSGITPIVRPSAPTPEAILRYLDLGAQGMIVPHVETKEDAEAAVRACKYYPMGERGLAGVRWARYGTAGPTSELVKEANQMTMVLALIESAKGVENLPEILTVDGIDVIRIGPSDLSQSLGLPGQASHPTVRAYIDRVIDTCVKANRPVGIGAGTVDAARKVIAQGVRMVDVAARELLYRAGHEYVQSLGVE